MTVAPEATAVLSVRSLAVSYGGVRAVRDVSFDVEPGSTCALVGHNGAGKSSTLQAIGGFVPSRGTVQVDGADVSTASSRRRIESGLSLVPEGWGVLRTMTVADNLSLFAEMAPTAATARAWPVERIVEVFPILGERGNQLAGLLSGGERQMLSIACSLLQGPRCLMLDEPTAGLSPAMSETVWEACSLLNGEGMTLIIVAQEIERVLELVERVMVMQSGELSLDAPADETGRQRCGELLGFGVR